MKDKKDVLIRNSKIAWQYIQEKAVLVSSKTKKIHILYGCGGSVWKYLKEPRDIDALVHLICEEYDTTPPQAERDISKFLDKLKEEKLICSIK